VWQRKAEHGEYSHYSVLIMSRHLAFHDFFHAYRIEELPLRKGMDRGIEGACITVRPERDYDDALLTLGKPSPKGDHDESEGHRDHWATWIRL
jgi:hypothetical protein